MMIWRLMRRTVESALPQWDQCFLVKIFLRTWFHDTSESGDCKSEFLGACSCGVLAKSSFWWPRSIAPSVPYREIYFRYWFKRLWCYLSTILRHEQPNPAWRQLWLRERLCFPEVFVDIFSFAVRAARWECGYAIWDETYPVGNTEYEQGISRQLDLAWSVVYTVTVVYHLCCETLALCGSLRTL